MNDSPLKKLNFEADKENMPEKASANTAIIPKPIILKGLAAESVEEIKQAQKAITVAPTIKPEEYDEPLLQENPNRFVLFPIKYHEVSRVNQRITR